MRDRRQQGYEIAVVGDGGSIAGFGGLGLRTFPVTLDTDPEALLRDLMARDEFAIIYITEQVAERCDELIRSRSDSYLPAIIRIPSAASTGQGSSLEHLQEMVKTAVGFDVIENLPDEDKVEASSEDDADGEEVHG